MTRQRVTTREAADILDISVEAVRKRIERGQLDHEREDNRVFVYLDDDQTKSGHEVEGKGLEPLVESLREQVVYLREQLDTERQARTEERRRHDTIVAQLTSRIPQIVPPASSETPGGHETVEETSEGGQPRSDSPGAQGAKDRPFAEEDREPEERRSWWSRLFGE